MYLKKAPVITNFHLLEYVDKKTHTDIIFFRRSWRNWQTRTFEGRMGDHSGSSPDDRTILK